MIMVVYPTVSSATQHGDFLSETMEKNQEIETTNIFFKGKISYLSGNQPSVPFYKLGLYVGISELVLHVTDCEILQINGETISCDSPCNIILYNNSGFGTPGILMMMQVLLSSSNNSNFMISGSCDDYKIKSR